jgi:hypothetical protein
MSGWAFFAVVAGVIVFWEVFLLVIVPLCF